jgi:hypothetical protein
MYINTLEKKKTNEMVQEISENELKQKYSLFGFVTKLARVFFTQFSNSLDCIDFLQNVNI